MSAVVLLSQLAELHFDSMEYMFEMHSTLTQQNNGTDWYIATV